MKSEEIYKKLEELHKQAVEDLIDEIPEEYKLIYELQEKIKDLEKQLEEKDYDCRECEYGW